ncbi:MAG: hypothetical protein JJ863_20835 [Deltaproteobacteria bacterium]|nr:hypothetical protein [Deltaproteobacteria bacterium]
MAATILNDREITERGGYVIRASADGSITWVSEHLPLVVPMSAQVGNGTIWVSSIVDDDARPGQRSIRVARVSLVGDVLGLVEAPIDARTSTVIEVTSMAVLEDRALVAVRSNSELMLPDTMLTASGYVLTMFGSGGYESGWPSIGRVQVLETADGEICGVVGVDDRTELSCGLQSEETRYTLAELAPGSEGDQVVIHDLDFEGASSFTGYGGELTGGDWRGCVVFEIAAGSPTRTVCPDVTGISAARAPGGGHYLASESRERGIDGFNYAVWRLTEVDGDFVPIWQHRTDGSLGTTPTGMALSPSGVLAVGLEYIGDSELGEISFEGPPYAGVGYPNHGSAILFYSIPR